MAEEVKLVNADEFLQDGGVPPPTRFAPPERRVKVLPVGEEQFLGLIYLLQGDTPGFVTVPRMPNLPEGTKIERVEYDFMRRSFLFLLSHPSFEAVPDGMPAPYVEERLWREYTAYQIEKLPVKAQG